MKATIVFALFFPLFLADAIAEEASSSVTKKRGLVTSASCPYTCKDAGVPEHLCHESRVGNTCQVEDFSQSPGHRTMVRVKPKRKSSAIQRNEQPRTRRAVDGTWVTVDSKTTAAPYKRGFITSASCPYSCSDTRIPKHLCRESRVGNICRVEDLTQPPGHQSMMRLRMQ